MQSSTTPTSAPPSRHSRQRSTSRSRQPTTPLRATSRTSLRASTTTPNHGASRHSTTGHPLDVLEPAFAEFSDSMADLEANMMHLQLLQESLNRFNDNFGAFLYGMNMNAFTVDFTEAPTPESFKRAEEGANKAESDAGQFGFRGGFTSAAATGRRDAAPTGLNPPMGGGLGRGDVDATFLTTDTSFVENPPTPRTTTSSRSRMAPATPSASSTRTPAGRGRGGRETGTMATRGRGAPVVRGTRASALAASRRETIARGRGRGSGLLN